MKTSYIYLDKYGILHAVSSIPNDYNYIKSEIEIAGGYPVKDGKKVVVYSAHECYVDGNRADGESKKLDTMKVYPDLAALYEVCCEIK